jgi:hypothetical protein
VVRDEKVCTFRIKGVGAGDFPYFVYPNCQEKLDEEGSEKPNAKSSDEATSRVTSQVSSHDKYWKQQG